MKKIEGFFLKADLDSVDIWTVDYVHIQRIRSGVKITMHQAEELLCQGLARYKNAFEPLSNNYFDLNGKKARELEASR